MKTGFQLFTLTLAALLAGGCGTSHLPAPKTVAERLQEYGPAARARLMPHFARAGLGYPPQRVTLIGLKAERELQLYADNGSGWKFIRAYPILGASGGLGPKLREGDRQVPEGIYPVDLLNSNSRHEIAMQIGYPNAFDRKQAAREGRADLGGEIMIHGGHTSIGCLAIGDDASAELFVLAADTGLANITVVLAPVDFRRGATVPGIKQLPPWTPELYAQIKTRLAELPLEKTP
jgi:hypothetical protein